MNWWIIVGLFLIVAGLIEWVLFRTVLARRAAIVRNRRLLMINAGVNLAVGAVLIVIGTL